MEAATASAYLVTCNVEALRAGNVSRSVVMAGPLLVRCEAAALGGELVASYTVEVPAALPFDAVRLVGDVTVAGPNGRPRGAAHFDRAFCPPALGRVGPVALGDLAALARDCADASGCVRMALVLTDVVASLSEQNYLPMRYVLRDPAGRPKAAPRPKAAAGGLRPAPPALPALPAPPVLPAVPPAPPAPAASEDAKSVPGLSAAADALKAIILRENGDELPAVQGALARLSGLAAASLAETRLCKVCFEAPLGAAFRPCGHACCCDACAAAQDRCPVCRGEKAG